MAPAGFWQKIKLSYFGHEMNREPVLAARTSALLAIAFTSLYVLPFYLSRKTRPTPTLNRDAPSVIRARIQSVSLTVTLSTLVTLYLLNIKAELSLSTSLHHLGLWPVDPLSILNAFLLTLILYVGPLYERIYLERDLSPISSLPSRVRSSLSSSQGYRNYVAGPLTEELLFRSTIIPLHLLAHVSATRITFLAPLYFGIAHLHHLYEFKLTHPDTPFTMALARSVLQFAYTTIFGWYASFLYLRTGNLYAVFIVHAFCNWVGLPRLWGKVQIDPRVSLAIVRGKEDTDVLDPHSSSSSSKTRMDKELVHTFIYYVLLFAGAYAFYCGLFSLTSGAASLADFGSKKVSKS